MGCGVISFVLLCVYVMFSVAWVLNCKVVILVFVLLFLFLLLDKRP